VRLRSCEARSSLLNRNLRSMNMFKLIAMLGVLTAGTGYAFFSSSETGSQSASSEQRKPSLSCCATPCPECSLGCENCCDDCNSCCGAEQGMTASLVGGKAKACSSCGSTAAAAKGVSGCASCCGDSCDECSGCSLGCDECCGLATK
jgi:hypothetical protein